MYNSLKPINIYTSERLPSQIYGIARRPENWRPSLLQEGRSALPAPLVCVFLGSLTQVFGCSSPAASPESFSVADCLHCHGVTEEVRGFGHSVGLSSCAPLASCRHCLRDRPDCCYLVGQTRSPMHSWKSGFSTCTPMLICFQPGWMALSKDVLSRE